MGQIEPVVKQTELGARRVGVITVRRVPGHGCQVDFHGEMETDARGKLVQLVMDRQARYAGDKLDGLLEPDRMPGGQPWPLHHHGDSVHVALSFREIGPEREITKLGLAARDQVVERDIRRIEMIHERLARIAVIDQVCFEPFLLERDPTRSRLAAVPVFRVVRTVRAVGRGRHEWPHGRPPGGDRAWRED